MKVQVKDVFKPVLKLIPTEAGKPFVVEGTVSAINKTGVFIDGLDGCLVPITLVDQDGEQVKVGAVLKFELESGIVLNLTGGKAVKTARRNGTATPDYESKSNGF